MILARQKQAQMNLTYSTLVLIQKALNYCFMYHHLELNQTKHLSRLH